MQYAAENAKNANAGVLGAYQGAAIGGASFKQQEVPPLTLASALSRSENLNERIQNLAGRLSEVAGKLGTLYPVAGNSGEKTNRIASGVVDRLNEAADTGHGRLTDAEALLSGIERALG